MNKRMKTVKRAGRYTWEMFKNSILASIMYFCASAVLTMVLMRDEVAWGGTKILWTVVCILGAAGYQALVAWANGSMQYEMLVSGNVKRSTYDAYGNEYKMSNHKECKEYRPWKGFVVGGFVALLPLVFGIIWGCNQAKIDSGNMGKGLAIVVLISWFLSGWSLLPFYAINYTGGSVSYFVSLVLVLIPIAVSGIMYIAGAYRRRNKAIRLQMLAEKAAEEEAARRANKKINYGALPGTKPKKRK